MDVSIEELQAFWDELDRIYNVLREEYRNADLELLRIKMLGLRSELKFFLDSRETL